MPISMEISEVGGNYRQIEIISKPNSIAELKIQNNINPQPRLKSGEISHSYASSLEEN